jgi:hypothetical protein
VTDKHYIQHTFLSVPLTQHGAPAGRQNHPDRVATVRVPEEEACAWRVVLQAPLFMPPILDTSWEPAQGGASGGLTGLRARVEWGVQGQAQNRAEMDWVRGLSFNVHGAYVHVDVVSDLLNTFGLGTAQAGAIIVPSTDGDASPYPPVLSVDTGVLTGVSSTVLDIPDYAVGFRWFCYSNTQTTANGSPVRFVQADDAAFTRIRWDTRANVGAVVQTAATTSYLTWGPVNGTVPIIGTARKLQVTNLDIAAAGIALGMWIQFVLNVG